MADKTANVPVTGAKDSGIAAPETDKDTATQEEPVESNEEMFDEEPEETAAETQTAEPAQPAAKANTPDQNAVYADIRRRAESEARAKASQEAQRIAQAEVDRTIAEMGLTDPYTNKPIRTKAEYDAYKTRHNTETISRELDKAGITREAMDALIDSHPAVQQAKTAAKAYEEAKRHEQELAAKTHFENQLKEISALDNTVKTYEDLAKQPNYELIRGYVKKGLTILEAYKMANFDTLSGKKAQAAAQSAYNSAASKDHLTSTTGRGQGEIPMTRAQMDWYRKMRPNMTEKQIREDYARNRIK